MTEMRKGSFGHSHIILPIANVSAACFDQLSRKFFTGPNHDEGMFLVSVPSATAEGLKSQIEKVLGALSTCASGISATDNAFSILDRRQGAT